MGLLTGLVKGVALAGVGVAHSLGSAVELAGSMVKPTVSNGAKIVVGLAEVAGEVAKAAANVVKPK